MPSAFSFIVRDTQINHYPLPIIFSAYKLIPVIVIYMSVILTKNSELIGYNFQSCNIFKLFNCIFGSLKIQKKNHNIIIVRCSIRRTAGEAIDKFDGSNANTDNKTYTVRFFTARSQFKHPNIRAKLR